MDPTKDQLLQAPPGSLDTDALSFEGLRGDSRLHLSKASIEAKLAALPPAPTPDL